jgi:hypothetical protein
MSDSLSPEQIQAVVTTLKAMLKPVNATVRGLELEIRSGSGSADLVELLSDFKRLQRELRSFKQDLAPVRRPYRAWRH